MLNMKKKLEKEEQELRERKSALELARKLAADKQQKVMEQDEDGAATPLAAPLAPPPAVPPAVPPENTPLDPAGDDMDDDLLDEINPPVTKGKGEFGAIQVPTNKQEFQQWTAGLDRESVREALSPFSSTERTAREGRSSPPGCGYGVCFCLWCRCQ